LAGHRCFKYYLNRFKHCPLCESDNEDAEHVFFVCPRFESERRDLSIAFLGNNVDVRALTETMLIEIKDIDETTYKTDILCAVQSQFDVELPESAVVSLRAAYGGTRTATLKVMPDIGRRLMEKGKIRLGWTWCKVLPKGLLHASAKWRKIEWEMPVLQEGYARA